jgi:hypothetical protein
MKLLAGWSGYTEGVNRNGTFNIHMTSIDYTAGFYYAAYDPG